MNAASGRGHQAVARRGPGSGVGEVRGGRASWRPWQLSGGVEGCRQSGSHSSLRLLWTDRLRGDGDWQHCGQVCVSVPILGSLQCPLGLLLFDSLFSLHVLHASKLSARVPEAGSTRRERSSWPWACRHPPLPHGTLSPAWRRAVLLSSCPKSQMLL